MDSRSRVVVLERWIKILGAVLVGLVIIIAVGFVILARIVIPISLARSFSHNQTPSQSGAIIAATVPGPSTPAVHSTAEPIAEVTPVPLAILTVTVAGKRLLPIDFQAERFSPYVELLLLVTNKGAHEIRAFEGSLEVHDLLGNPVTTLYFTDQSRIARGRMIALHEDWKINEFNAGQTQLAAEKMENLKFKWLPEKILFSDGSTLQTSSE